jgi:hypothetical protein
VHHQLIAAALHLRIPDGKLLVPQADLAFSLHLQLQKNTPEMHLRKGGFETHDTLPGQPQHTVPDLPADGEILEPVVTDENRCVRGQVGREQVRGHIVHRPGVDDGEPGVIVGVGLGRKAGGKGPARVRGELDLGKARWR